MSTRLIVAYPLESGLFPRSFASSLVDPEVNMFLMCSSHVPGKGPGKRWRFSVAYDGVSMMIFGGHRLWHGFATDNAQENAWSSFSQYSKGGFLDDLWIYSKKILDADEQVNRTPPSVPCPSFTHRADGLL